MLLSNGELDRALTMGLQVLAHAQRLNERMLDAMARCRLGQIHHARGEYRQALDVLRHSIHLAEMLPIIDHGHGAAGVSVLAHSWFAFCSADLGIFSEGQEHADEAIELAQRTGSPWSMATALTCVGYFHLRRGRFDLAIKTLESAFTLCRTFDLHALSVPSGGAMATAYALTGRVADSREILEQARALALSMKMGGWHPLWLMLLAEAFAAAQWNEDAAELAKTVLDVASGQGAQGYQAYALRTLGDATREAEESAAYYLQSIQLADRLGQGPLVAHCHLGLGKLYRRTGKPEQSRDHLTTATTMYREMGMTYWLEQAATEMKELH
jgi:tetratricopeptide (TPR) repeat protein